MELAVVVSLQVSLLSSLVWLLETSDARILLPLRATTWETHDKAQSVSAISA